MWRRLALESLEQREMLAIDAAEGCRNLASMEFEDTEITSAIHVETAPSYCLIRGTIEGNIAFVWTMPDPEAWQQRTLHLGLGGFSGSLPASGHFRKDLLNRGYAFGGSNLGHFSSSLSADWAWNEATEDFNQKETR